MTHGGALPKPIDHTRLWLGVLLAPGAWLVVEGLGYVVAARLCALDVLGADTTHPAAPSYVQLVICAVGFIAALCGLWISARNLRANPAPGADGTPAQGRARFMAMAGVIVSVLFAGSIVLYALPAFVLDACHRART